MALSTKKAVVTAEASTPGPRPETPDPLLADWFTPRRFAVFLLFAFILVCLGVIVLRHADPNRPRPFRVPAAIGRMPILPLLAIASILWLLAYFDWHIYFAGAIALGLTALTFVARQWTRRAMMD